MTENAEGGWVEHATAAVGSSPVDLAALAPFQTLVADGSVLLRRLVAVFLEDAEERIADMRSASKTRDRARVHRAAHTLKSSAAMLGAFRLSALCRELQDGSAGPGPDIPAGLVESIASEFARVAKALSGIVEQGREPHVRP